MQGRDGQDEPSVGAESSAQEGRGRAGTSTTPSFLIFEAARLTQSLPSRPFPASARLLHHQTLLGRTSAVPQGRHPQYPVRPLLDASWSWNTLDPDIFFCDSGRTSVMFRPRLHRSRRSSRLCSCPRSLQKPLSRTTRCSLATAPSRTFRRCVLAPLLPPRHDGADDVSLPLCTFSRFSTSKEHPRSNRLRCSTSSSLSPRSWMICPKRPSSHHSTWTRPCPARPSSPTPARLIGRC